MNKLWPCGPIQLHLGAPLLYGMLRAVTAACGVSGCFEACGGGWSAWQAARGCCEVKGGTVFVRGRLLGFLKIENRFLFCFPKTAPSPSHVL